MKYAYLDYPLQDFPAGSTVVDVGCGSGRFLSALVERGIKAIGVEPNANSVAICKEKGLNALVGRGEKLPLPDACCDGLICNVTLPFMDEPAAVAEWARVLKPGAEALIVGHGFGYPLWLMQNVPFRPIKLYGASMFVATWLYWLTGKRIGPICQTSGRMRKFYGRSGLTLLQVDESQRYRGLPVVMFHRIRKASQ